MNLVPSAGGDPSNVVGVQRISGKSSTQAGAFLAQFRLLTTRAFSIVLHPNLLRALSAARW